LFTLRQDADNCVVGLLTTINEDYDRIAMHSVRRELLEEQANSAGVELWPVLIRRGCSNDLYEQAMRAVLARAKDAGITTIAFGDLFLEDIRRAREAKMAGMGFELLFPLWGRPTGPLAVEMLDGGLQATVTCVDPRALDPSFAGREWGAAFLRDLPRNVDPCGENGEFHTFVHAGPMLSRPVATRPGDVVHRDGFVFADLLSAED
jgi:diphthamide synthase (EF-2-diphthine--ammonia ligase)